MCNNVTLEELLSHLQNKEMQYFDDFFERTKNKVFYVAYSILKDFGHAEDILQDVYIQFLKHIKKVDPKNSIVGYLMKIAKNLSLNEIKKKKRLVFSDILEETHLQISNETQYENLDLIDRMRKVLKDSEFEIVILHIINDMPHRERAEFLKKPLGTITWSYNNAIGKLKGEYNEK